MTAAAAPDRGHRPVSVVEAGGLLAAAMVVMALLSITVARLLPAEEVESAIAGDVTAPASAAPAPGLADVAPAVTFDRPGPGLPPGTLGPWDLVAGDWTTAEGVAAATATGPDGALAVNAAPDGATIVQVTVTDARPGAGLVVSYRDVAHYVALAVSRSGNTVELVSVDGDPGSPQVLASARLVWSSGPIVLALRDAPVGLEAIVNGQLIGRRAVDRPAGPWRVGLVTGGRARATEARFDDLTVA